MHVCCPELRAVEEAQESLSYVPGEDVGVHFVERAFVYPHRAGFLDGVVEPGVHQTERSWLLREQSAEHVAGV